MFSIGVGAWRGIDVVDLPLHAHVSGGWWFVSPRCTAHLPRKGSFDDNVLVATSSLDEVIVGLCFGHDLGGE